MRIALVVAMAAGVACSKDVGSRRNEPTAPPPNPGALPQGHSGTPPTPVVTGTIALGDGLAAPAKATLFITGRTGPGGPPALVKKVDAPTFPYQFVLTSADVMMQGFPVPESLLVQARLDQDGDAISRSAGDLAGKLEAPVKNGASGVSLVLSEVVP